MIHTFLDWAAGTPVREEVLTAQAAGCRRLIPKAGNAAFGWPFGVKVYADCICGSISEKTRLVRIRYVLGRDSHRGRFPALQE